MSDETRNLLQIESAYLSGVERNFESAKGKQFVGNAWKTARFDQGDRLRAAMARHRNYDRERLKSLPQNRGIALHGYRRGWLFGKKRTGVAIATVLCSIDALAEPDGPTDRPVTLADLMHHVRELVQDASVPHLVGVCAPSGFTEEAREATIDLANVSLVLVEPTADGGWEVVSRNSELGEEIVGLFDPERGEDKIERVCREIERRGADLIAGSLSADTLARKLSLPEPIVVRAMRRVAEKDPELRVTAEGDGVILYRGVAGTSPEKPSMNVVDRIRQLFSKDGEEEEKINVLSERRAKLVARKDRMYAEIAKLEEKESELLDQGKKTSSTVVRRRLAGQLAQLRKDISRQNTITTMLNKQIDILSTDIHNLTLIQQGNMAKLPSSEELTENAVQAEEMLETLSADADLVGQLETSMAESSMSDDELAILKEFETAAPEQKREKTATRSSESKRAPADTARASSSADASPPIAEADDLDARSGETTDPDRNRDAEPG